MSLADFFLLRTRWGWTMKKSNLYYQNTFNYQQFWKHQRTEVYFLFYNNKQPNNFLSPTTCNLDPFIRPKRDYKREKEKSAIRSPWFSCVDLAWVAGTKSCTPLRSCNNFIDVVTETNASKRGICVSSRVAHPGEQHFGKFSLQRVESDLVWLIACIFHSQLARWGGGRGVYKWCPVQCLPAT